MSELLDPRSEIAVADTDPAPDGAWPVRGRGPVPAAAVTAGETATDDAALDRAFAHAPDAAVFEQVFRRWSSLVHLVAWRSLGDAATADDITQQVFIRAWRGRSTFDPSAGTLAAWLTGITKRLVIDHHRSQSRSRRLVDRLARTRDESTHDPLDRVIDLAVLEAALDALGSPRRELVEMAYLQGMTHQAISHRTGLPIGTVKSHLRRGLDRLRTYVGSVDSASRP